jgi:hypothetical protein
VGRPGQAGRSSPSVILSRGEVSEWLKVPLSKSGVREHRGFESHPLRHSSIPSRRCGRRRPYPPMREIAAERSPSGLGRRTGNAVWGNPSRVQIPPSPPPLLIPRPPLCRPRPAPARRAPGAGDAAARAAARAPVRWADAPWRADLSGQRLRPGRKSGHELVRRLLEGRGRLHGGQRFALFPGERECHHLACGAVERGV